MKNFESNIANIINKGVKFHNKDAVLKKIMQQHVVEDALLVNIKNSVESVKLSVNQRYLMKEKLMMYVDATVETFVEKVFSSVFAKKLVSSFGVFVLIFAMVIQPFSKVDTVRASVPAVIATYSGNVTVFRGDLEIAVDNGFILQQGDILITGPAGFAEIVFADESLARLGNSSKLQFRSLNANYVNSQIVLKLDKGLLWNNTLGLAGRDAFYKVYAEDLISTSKNEAVFNVEVNSEFSRVVSLENSLNLDFYYNNSFVPAKLQKGQLIKVKKEFPIGSKLSTQNFENELSEFDLDWLSSNFKQDEFYRDLIVDNRYSQVKDKAGITPDSLFYPIKEFQRTAKLALIFDPIKQSELEVQIANQKLAEAQMLMSEGKTEIANNVLQDYSKTLISAANNVKKVAENPKLNKSELKRVTDLKSNISNSIVLQKKNSKEVLDVVEGIAVKKYINEAELMIAASDAEKKKIKVAQATDLLVDAVKLAKVNRPELVEANLDEYKKQLTELSQDFKQMTDTDKSDVIAEVVNQGVETMSVLADLVVSTEKIEVSNSALNAKDVVENINYKIDLPSLKDSITEAKKLTENSLKETLAIAKEVKDPVAVEDIKKITIIAENIAQIGSVVASPNLIVDELLIPNNVNDEFVNGSRDVIIAPETLLPTTQIIDESENGIDSSNENLDLVPVVLPTTTNSLTTLDSSTVQVLPSIQTESINQFEAENLIRSALKILN